MLQKKCLDKLAVAVVYDRVNSQGGAEIVLKNLQQIFPKAVLFTSVYEPARAKWISSWTVRTSWLQRIPWLRTRHRLLGWLMPLIFESFDLTGFDLVISVSSEFAKSVITQPQQLHVCYLLTPTRYLWSHQREYLFSLPKSVQPLASWLFSRLQKWDYVAARRPDLIVPISNLVATRAYEFYDLVTAAPIYPPLKNYQTNKKEKKLTKFTSDYIFSWGRLVRYKKFDLLIKAAIRAQKKLYIAGVGPDKHRLQKIARQLDPQRQWIHFLGYLEPSELVEYISKAKVAAFVQVEDFGLVALEAVAQGCPVIVNRKSGVAEVLTQKQAFFVDSFSLQELTDTLNKSFAQTRSKLDIMFPTSHYAEEKWQVKFKSQLEDYWQIYQTKLKEEHGITS